MQAPVLLDLFGRMGTAEVQALVNTTHMVIVYRHKGHGGNFGGDQSEYRERETLIPWPLSVSKTAEDQNNLSSAALCPTA